MEMTPLVQAAAGPATMSGLRYRLSIRELAKDPERMGRFVEALKVVMSKPSGDESSYQHIAGIHGNPPPHDCDHQLGFFPWHRAYLLKLERALNKVDPSVALPWWDFTSEASRQGGVPQPYRSPQDGGEAVLYSATIEADGGRSTDRDPDVPEALPAQEVVDRALDQNDYVSMWRTYYFQVHNALHGWVGGDALSQNWTAFDPIFWAFHCSNDRHWALWQRTHESPPPDLDTPMKGLDMTPREVLDINKLGYEYATVLKTVEKAEEQS